MRLADQIGCKAAWTLRERGARFQILFKVFKHTPVKVYNWMHNNIAYIPSYGSIQGSELTLQNKRGNAFDTASLLIALYRSAGIPARYVYGTIDVPADKVMNWVGGVTKAEAAQSLLGQGGIPNTALTYGGKIQTIRMEHVWVEAYVDYFPSRGAVNKTPNTWVPVDASFKQYTFAPQVDVAATLGFDKAAYEQAFLRTAIIDSNGNRISGGDGNALGSQIEEYQHKALTWAKSIGFSEAMDKLQGKKTIQQIKSPILYGSLPYNVVVRANEFQSLPANLRWSINVNYFASENDAAYENAVFSKSISLPKLGGQKLGLSFAPATDADASTLQSLKDQNASSLPAYLINGIPRLTLDGTSIAQGSSTQFGTQQIVVITMSDPQGRNGVAASYKITVGDETVFAVNAAGVTQATIDARFAKVASDTASENLQTAGNVFWFLHDLNDQIVAGLHKVTAVRLPSVGAFGAPLVVRYFFGIPRSASYMGRYGDVKRVVLAATTNDGKIPIDFMRQIGMQGSDFEGLAFDITFNREVGTSASATRWIKLAQDSGASILKITNDNQAVLPALSIPEDVKIDIQNAIAAGMEVLVPDREITSGSLKGIGYVLFDPTTGSGAYLINGGYNGVKSPPVCGEETVTAPASQAVTQPNFRVTDMIALFVIAVLAFEFVIAAALVGLVISASTAVAAPAPGAGLSAAQNEIWEVTFGRVFGQFPTGPNFPGDGIDPPGNCTEDQHKALEDEKNSLCGKPTQCKKNECDIAVIDERIANRNACIASRLLIMTTCFKDGDGRHWNHIKEDMNGLATCKNCLSKAMSNQCQK
jgi:hypothetical protein